MKTYLYIFIILFILIFTLISDDKFFKRPLVALQKPQVTSDIWLDANRFRGVFRNNGIWHFKVIENTQGTEWPAGSGKSPIFAAGQWIGARTICISAGWGPTRRSDRFRWGMSVRCRRTRTGTR